MKIAQRKRRGFTLIEILMAMAIFGLVLSAIYSTWMAILRGSQSGLAVAAQVQRERMAIQTIEDALTSAQSYAASVQYYGFEAENGNEARLSFVAQLPRGFPRGGRFEKDGYDVRRVAFSLESDRESQKQLVVRQCALLYEFDQDEREHPLVLAKNVQELRFEFWDKRLGEWADGWLLTNQLPQLVKVTLRMAQPKQQANAADADEVVRIIELPAMTAPANWQTPNLQRPPGT